MHRFFGAPDGSGDDAVIGVFTTARKAGRNGSRVHTLEIAATDRPGILRLNETAVYTPSYATEQVFMPGHLGTYAGQKTERIEGWIVRRSNGDWVALAQDRLLGQRLIFTIPHASRAETANESFLVLVRTDAYGGADAVAAIGETRATMVAGDVSEWARKNTWAYRYRPPEMRGKV